MNLYKFISFSPYYIKPANALLPIAVNGSKVKTSPKYISERIQNNNKSSKTTNTHTHTEEAENGKQSQNQQPATTTSRPTHNQAEQSSSSSSIEKDPRSSIIATVIDYILVPKKASHVRRLDHCAHHPSTIHPTIHTALHRRPSGQPTNSVLFCRLVATQLHHRPSARPPAFSAKKSIIARECKCAARFLRRV